MTNSELGTRIPLLFRVPWLPQSFGVKSDGNHGDPHLGVLKRFSFG